MDFIYQDVQREDNINGRAIGFVADGPFTRYVEVVRDDIVVTASDNGPDGKAVELHRAKDILRGQEFATRTILAKRSGVDGHVLVILGGLTPGTSNSRSLRIKLGLVVAPEE